jgi:DNA-binding transcriptional LysR family regulator
MNRPELRHLRYFVAVAERLHFGRAAASLHMTQPPLTRSIQELEQIIGATLLSRTRRRVELTAEGAWFLGEAKRLLAQLDNAVIEAARMAAGRSGSLRIGFVSLADYGVLPPLLRSYKTSRPGVSLALREMLSPDQAAALATGDLDFGLLLPPVAGDLEHIVVQRERFLAALPARHRLAKQAGRIRVRNLADESFIMVPRPIAPALHDVILDLASRAGFVPRLAQEAIQMQTVVSLVSAGMGVALVPGSVGNLGRRGVAYRELADPHPQLDVWLAWRRGSLSAAGGHLVETARAARRTAAARGET